MEPNQQQMGSKTEALYDEISCGALDHRLSKALQDVIFAKPHTKAKQKLCSIFQGILHAIDKNIPHLQRFLLFSDCNIGCQNADRDRAKI